MPSGPLPAGPRGRPELSPKDDEDLCFLSGEWRLFQKLDGHRWTIDDLITAFEASRLSPTGAALDLGCGLGSVLLMLAWKWPQLSATGIEAQPERAEMARRSIAYNGAESRCQVLDGDLRTLSLEKRFSLITGTPPYFAVGTGIEAKAEHVSACRFEHRGGAEAYLAAAERHLTSDGHFVLCTAATEDARVLATPTSLLLKRRLRVFPRSGKEQLLTISTFSTRAEPLDEATLTVRDGDGQWTPEFRNVRAALGLPTRPPSR